MVTEVLVVVVVVVVLMLVVMLLVVVFFSVVLYLIPGLPGGIDGSIQHACCRYLNPAGYP